MTDELRLTASFYAGPEGVSDQRAAATFSGVGFEDVLPLATFESIVQTVDLTPGVAGILPLEDSLRGEYRQVHDLLIEQATRSRLVRTAVLAEILTLQALDPSKRPTVVYSHMDILGIFSSRLAELEIEGRPVASTRHACQLVEAQGNPFQAAIAPAAVGRAAGLVTCPEVLEIEVEVRTRYGLLCRSMTTPSGSDRSLLYVEPSDDRPGTLKSVLEHFASHQVNLLRLRSQNRGPDAPHGFVLEIEGHPQDGPVRSSMAELLASGVSIKVLGAFPEAPRSPSPDRVISVRGVTSDPEGLDSLVAGGPYT